MGFWKENWNALKSFDGIKICYDKKRDIFMAEVKNKPNIYVPRITRIFESPELSLMESTNDEPNLMENFFGNKSKKDCLEKKQIEAKFQLLR